MEQIAQQFEQALLNNDKIEAHRIIEAEAARYLPMEIVNKMVVPALERIGNSWQEGKVALSQIYMSGRICESLIDELLPPSSTLRTSQPKMAIAVLNDYHFLGKRIVYSHLRSAGFDLIDYGMKNVNELVDSICKDSIKIVLISTLMYPSALNVREVKDKIKVLSPEVKIIVGGAPFNMDDQLWKSVGADAMGSNGGEAIACVNKMMEAMK